MGRWVKGRRISKLPVIVIVFTNSGLCQKSQEEGGGMESVTVLSFHIEIYERFKNSDV